MFIKRGGASQVYGSGSGALLSLGFLVSAYQRLSRKTVE